jgi:hypothetical protein
MPLFGTIVNGEVKLDQPTSLPDGSRVTVLLDEEDEFSPPPPQESYAEHLTQLRESIRTADSGEPRYSIDEVMREVTLELAKAQTNSRK